LWDTSWLLTNGSLVGQAVHVLTGYEARPSGMQLVFWIVTFVVLVAGMRFMSMRVAAQKRRRAARQVAREPEAARAA
jgi:high-affinity iron transporter